jgi:hypothetical protein
MFDVPSAPQEKYKTIRQPADGFSVLNRSVDSLLAKA